MFEKLVPLLDIQQCKPFLSGIQHFHHFSYFRAFSTISFKLIKCSSFRPILEDREMQARVIKRGYFQHPPSLIIICELLKYNWKTFTFSNVHPLHCEMLENNSFVEFDFGQQKRAISIVGKKFEYFFRYCKTALLTIIYKCCELNRKNTAEKIYIFGFT